VSATKGSSALLSLQCALPLVMALTAGPLSAATTPVPGQRTTAAAKAAEPTGFGTAKFGMSLAEVWKMYPKAKLLGPRDTLGASAVDGPYIDRLALHDQPVPGFAKPTTVELRFWKDKLWAVVVYFGDNDPEACKIYLTQTFGPSASPDPNSPSWPGTKVSTSAVYKQNWYGFSDDAISKEAAAWFGDALKGVWKGETAEEKAAREQRMAALTPHASNPAATSPPSAR
jgi:hypothetical protein